MNKMTLAAEFESVKPKIIQFTKEELVAFRKRIEDEMKERCAMKADEFYSHMRQYTTDAPDIGDAIRRMT